ncbi:MAG: flagellar M-ring protein FliF [Desulfosarcina sp.]|nr:flagellar M-ring protein FliF [Desulfobacterales bacterium]
MAESPDFFDQLKTLLANLSPAKRIIFLTVVVAVVAGFIFIINWTTRPEFGILYKNLSPEDAGVILSKLKENKVDYRISSNGTSISIPDDLIYEKRMELASQGLPKGGGVGFEIFDNTNLGITEFVQNVNYQRALQGELSRTISKFDEVANARVHIVMSSRSLFIEQDEPATASVVLTMRRGRMLNQNQVQGIIHLVSSSISGLNPDNITVIDSNGTMLTNSKDGSLTGKISNDQLEFKENLEKSLEKRVKTMLETALGSNKSVVRISCALDFKKSEKTEETYYPENQVVRSEQLASSISKGTDNIPSGVPGVSSNIAPGKKKSALSGTNKNFEKQNKTVNYEIGKRINHIIEPVGTITKLSIAVMIDGKYEYQAVKQAKNAGKGKGSGAVKNQEGLIYIARTKEEMQNFEEIVKRAVNFDEQRGDAIKIVNIPFESSQLTVSDSDVEPQGWLSKLKENKTLMKYSFSILALLLAFIFVVRPLIKWITSFTGGEVDLLKELPMTVSELEKGFGEQNQRLPFSAKALDMITNDTENSAKVAHDWLEEK